MNQKEASIFSLYTYATDDRNEPNVPSGWVVATVRTQGSGGFAYTVFRNASTNEVVVAFRGSDDIADWFGTNSGFTIAQEKQAAVVAAQVIGQYGASNVSFTGHSLGGGLAGTMSVWFNRPAIVFDPAPTQSVATDLSVVNSVIGTLGTSAPQSIKDYAAAISTQFAARELNVTSYFAPGSPVHIISTEANTITGVGQGNAVNFGFANLGTTLGDTINRHSQALLTAGVLAPQTFPQATVVVQRALPLIFNTALYDLPPAKEDRNFLRDLIRNEQNAAAGSGKLTNFAADLNKLGTNLAGLNQAAQDALVAQGIEWYYWQSENYAGQQRFFNESGGTLQYATATGDGLANAQDKTTRWVDSWLTPMFNDSGAFGGNVRAEQWSVSTNVSASTAAARDSAKTQMFVGNAGADSFTGGDKADTLFGNAGNDTLDGGAGSDLLFGGQGADTYRFTGAFGSDTVRDADGQGRITLGGAELSGIASAAVQLSANVWQSADKLTTFTKTDSALIVTSKTPGAEGSITIQNWTSGNLGINLGNAQPQAPDAIRLGDQHGPIRTNAQGELYYDWSVTAWQQDGSLQGGVNEADYADVLFGTSLSDRIRGLGGNDALDGGAGIRWSRCSHAKTRAIKSRAMDVRYSRARSRNRSKSGSESVRPNARGAVRP